MSEGVPTASANFFRVGIPGGAAFQLRSGEEGLSVFAEDGVGPPLTEAEVLSAFRPGSVILIRSREEAVALGLEVVAIEGDENLPDRLRQAHREFRSGQGMTRSQFKQSLKRLE